MKKYFKKFLSLIVCFIMIFSIPVSAKENNIIIDTSEIISTYEPISNLLFINTKSNTLKNLGIDWEHHGWTEKKWVSVPDGTAMYVKRAKCTTKAINLDNPNDKVYHYSRARLEHYINGSVYGDSGRNWGYTYTSATSGWGAADIYVGHTYYGN